MIKRLFVLIFLCSLAIGAAGQNQKVNHTTQFWSEVDLLGRINRKLKWQCDVQYSRQSPYEEFTFVKYGEQLTVRPWLHYYLKPTLRLSGFLGLWYNFYIPENVNQREYPEYRAAIQAQLYRYNRDDLFSFRFRTEFREIKDTREKFETVLRERMMFKFQKTLTHVRSNKAGAYLIAQDELFINDGSPVTGHTLFDQNRVFLGLGYNVTDNIAIEAGYFNQFAHHAHDPNFDSNHILQATLIIDNLTDIR